MWYTSRFITGTLRDVLKIERLWNGSWADDSVRWDEVSRVAYEPSRIKKIEHEGEHLKLSARHQLHPSPQRTPVLVQAGTSKPGMAFAARHAEAIYIGGMIPSQAAGQIIVSICSLANIPRRSITQTN
jgi:alkanesulfonate monooxygenase SsuD/methylene tetrahydromethanopterin reductase-like flavin-dependent oxidoreductase (luciferase family)